MYNNAILILYGENLVKISYYIHLFFLKTIAFLKHSHISIKF